MGAKLVEADWFKALTRGGNRNLIGQVAREALTRSIQSFWHRRILPKHFEENAGRKYPRAYLPRGRAYQRKKERVQHHRRPMVWSGRFMRGVLGRRPEVDPPKSGGRSIKVTAKLKAGGRAANLWSGKLVSKAGHRHVFKVSLAAMNRADRVKFIRFISKAVRALLRKAQREGQQKRAA